MDHQFYFRILFCLIIGSQLISGCETPNWDLDRVDFVTLKIESLDLTRFDEATFTASVQNLKHGRLDEVGFVWSREVEAPSLSQFEGITRLGSKDTNDKFSGNIEGLLSSQLYHVVAFAQQGDRTFYSDPMDLSTSVAAVTTLSYSYAGTRTISLSGSLGGFDKGIKALEHGFCWSLSNPQPTLEDATAYLGNKNESDEKTFSHLAENVLQSNRLYFRAFGIFLGNAGLDTVFGDVITFNEPLWDVWEEGPYLGPDFGRSLSVSFIIDNKVYIGLGTRGRNIYAFRKDFKVFDPNGSPQWETVDDYPGGARFGSFSFVLNGVAYVGGGRDDSFRFKDDFYRFDPQQPSGSQWTKMASLPNYGSEDGSAFALNNVGYLIEGFTAYGETDEIWRYLPDSGTGQWERASTRAPSSPRRAASVMIIQGEVYWGLGQNSNEYFNDFYKFDGNTWTRLSDFPGAARAHAAGVGVDDPNGVGYVGFGENSVRYHKDLWAYDTGTNSWTQKADNPFTIISQGAAFHINKRIFFYTGKNYANDVSEIFIYKLP